MLPALPAQAEVRIVDGQGTAVVLNKPAERIVILYGAFGEILQEMGEARRVVARTKADAGLPAFAHLPSVGTHMRPNVEMVVGMQPDLVLQLAGRKAAAQTVTELRAHGMTVAAFSPSSFEELFQVITSLGVLTGEEAKAMALVTSMEERLEAVRAAVDASKAPVRVFYEIRGTNLLAAGQGGIVNDIITHAGGINVVENNKKIVRLGEEAVYNLDPDCYIVQQGPMNRSPIPLAERPLYAQLRAVETGCMLLVDEKMFSRPGPRTVLAVEKLARFLRGRQGKDIKEK